MAFLNLEKGLKMYPSDPLAHSLLCEFAPSLPASQGCSWGMLKPWVAVIVKLVPEMLLHVTWRSCHHPIAVAVLRREGCWPPPQSLSHLAVHRSALDPAPHQWIEWGVLQGC